MYETFDDSRLLAVLSHDLTAVLQGIRNNAEFGAQYHETKLVALAEIRSASMSGIRLLENMRIIRRESPPLYLRKTTIPDIARLITDTISEFEVKASHFKVSILFNDVTELNDNEYHLDSRVVTLAMANLIDNAIKYSIPESTVQIELSILNDHAICILIENASKIPLPLETENLYLLGYRGDAAIQSQSGIGIGLFVAKKLVDWHVGDITVSSNESDNVQIIMHIPTSSAGD